MPLPHARTLANLKARTALDRESRVYWYTASAVAYAARWWESMPPGDHPAILSRYTGDAADPFRRIPVSPAQYVAEGSRIVEAARENTIVAFVAAFETFLFEVCERAIFIQPHLVDQSDQQFSARDIAATIDHGRVRDWFANAVASHHLRNKPHHKAIDGWTAGRR